MQLPSTSNHESVNMEAQDSSQQSQSSIEQDFFDTTMLSRQVKLRQDQQALGAKSKLGFSLRGGKEATGNSVGVFVCHVEFQSEAHKRGLKVGDQLLEVNGLPVERATYEQVIQWVRLTPPGQQIELTVRNLGRIPVQTKSGDPIRWLIVGEEPAKLVSQESQQPQTTPNSSGDEGIESSSSSNGSQRSFVDSDQTTNSVASSTDIDDSFQPDKDHTVICSDVEKEEEEEDVEMIERVMIIRVPGKKSPASANTNTFKQQKGDNCASEANFGCEVVRGPADWPPGVYVQTVAPGSLAERVGLEPGDELLEAQEESLNEMPFEDSVRLIKRLQNEESELRLMVRKGAALNCLRRLRHQQHQQHHTELPARKQQQVSQLERSQDYGENNDRPRFALNKTKANGGGEDAADDKSISITENQLSDRATSPATRPSANYSNQGELVKQKHFLFLDDHQQQQELETQLEPAARRRAGDTRTNEQSRRVLKKKLVAPNHLNGDEEDEHDSSSPLKKSAGATVEGYESMGSSQMKSQLKLDSNQSHSNEPPATLQLTCAPVACQAAVVAAPTSDTCHKSATRAAARNNEPRPSQIATAPTSNREEREPIKIACQRKETAKMMAGNSIGCCCQLNNNNMSDNFENNNETRSREMQVSGDYASTKTRHQLNTFSPIQLQAQMTQQSRNINSNLINNNLSQLNHKANYVTDQHQRNLSEPPKIRIVKSLNCKLHGLQQQQPQIVYSQPPKSTMQMNQHPQIYHQQQRQLAMRQQPLVSRTSSLHNNNNNKQNNISSQQHQQHNANMRRQRQQASLQQTHTMQRYMSMDNISLQLNPYAGSQSQSHSSQLRCSGKTLASQQQHAAAERGQLLMIAGNMHHQHQQQQQQQQISLISNNNKSQQLIMQEQQLQKQLVMRQQEAAYCVAALHREQQMSRQIQQQQQQLSVATSRVFVARPRPPHRADCTALSHYNTAPSPAARLSKAKSMDKLNFNPNASSIASSTTRPSSRHTVSRVALKGSCCLTSRRNHINGCAICATESSEKMSYNRVHVRSRADCCATMATSDCCSTTSAGPNHARVSSREAHRVLECVACVVQQEREKSAANQHLIEIQSTESPETIIRLVSSSSSHKSSLVSRQKPMTTFRGSPNKQNLPNHKHQHQHHHRHEPNLITQKLDGHKRSSRNGNCGGGSDQMSPIYTPPQLSSDCGDEDDDEDAACRMRKVSSPSVSVSSVSSNGSSRSLNSLEVESVDSFVELEARGKLMQMSSSNGRQNIMSRKTHVTISSSSSSSKIPNAPPCPPMAMLLNDPPSQTKSSSSGGNSNANEKQLIARQQQRQSMCFLDELKSLARQSTTSCDSAISGSRNQPASGAPKIQQQGECDSRTLIKMINASKMTSRAAAAAAAAGSSANKRESSKSCAHCTSSGKNLTANVTTAPKSSSKSPPVGVIFCRKCRNNNNNNNNNSSDNQQASNQSKQLLISGCSANSSSSAISSAASTISFDPSETCSSGTGNKSRQGEEAGSSARTSSANNVISQADKQRRQHEMLMKEFKSVHSRMFGNKQEPDNSRQQVPADGKNVGDNRAAAGAARTNNGSGSNNDHDHDNDENSDDNNNSNRLHHSSAKLLQNAQAKISHKAKQLNAKTTTFNGRHHNHNGATQAVS